MRYERMLPYQIRQAIAEGWPVVLPLGVLEYHGEHLGVGMDTLAVTGVLERLEAEGPLVILPPFYYGAASYAVEPPEGNGSVQVPGEALAGFARGLFQGLLRVGFRNIHAIIHHQTENFAAGMPTDLAFKFAARTVIFDWLERERGEGWWGRPAMADYYAGREAGGDDPFNWIRIGALMPASMQGIYPFDHAGVGETSLMLALCPEVVDMGRIAAEPWYVKGAEAATKAAGEAGVALILAHWRRVLWGR